MSQGRAQAIYAQVIRMFRGRPSLVSASSIALKSYLRSSGASGGSVLGSGGCSCRQGTRKLASSDAGHAGYRFWGGIGLREQG